MTAVLPAGRADVERERELDEVNRLVREVGRQRPAPPPPALTELAERDSHDEAEGRC
jgi:hypothetical protein